MNQLLAEKSRRMNSALIGEKQLKYTQLNFRSPNVMVVIGF